MSEDVIFYFFSSSTLNVSTSCLKSFTTEMLDKDQNVAASHINTTSVLRTTVTRPESEYETGSLLYMLLFFFFNVRFLSFLEHGPKTKEKEK